MLNLVGEVGEFASKVAKAVRLEHASTIKDKLFIRPTLNNEHPLVKEFLDAANTYGDESLLADIAYHHVIAEEDRIKEELLQHLKLEAGDILWQLSGLCSTFGWSLQDIAQMNLDKLASRQQRGKIIGDGDDR